MCAIVVSAERFRNASSAASNELSSKTSNDEFRDETERREHEQAGFLASLEAEPSENVIAGPAKWFDHSPWRTPHLYSTWPGALVRKAELESGREEIPPGASGMRMMAAGAATPLDAETKFRDDASRRGLELPNQLIYGQLSRCSVAGDKGKKQSGSYLYYADRVPAGGFQNFKDGLGWQDWRAELSHQPSAAEIEENRRRRKETDAQRAADEAARNAEAAKKAAWIWKRAKPAPANHPYLLAKGVAAHGLRLWKDSLVVPVQDVDGELHSLQFIMADGTKRFLAGGRTRGCFYLIGTIDPTGTIIPGEGFATCATVRDADPNWAIAVAFDAGNLEAVARALKDRYPKAGFIIAADDDWKTVNANGKPANPGRDYGLKAAKAIGARFALPVFDPGRYRLDEWTDFNDLHAAEGIGRVRDCIDAAEYVGDATTEQDEKSELEALLDRLALLSEIDYERAKEAELKKPLLKKLGIKPKLLDKLVQRVKEANKAAAVRETYEVLGEARDFDNTSWSLLVTSRDRDGKPHDLLLSRAELIADYKWLERWANHGFNAPSSTKGKAILRQELLEAACDKRVRLVWRTGWHGHIFVLPDTVYGASEEVYRYAGDARGVLYGQKGTLGEWRAEVAAMATGNSRLILGMSLAFSGPLFDLFEVETIGVHFEGPSSTGKSTAGFGAGSVWGGGGRNGFTQSWRATGNGLEGIAKAHSGTLLCLEEIGEIDPKEVGSVAYMLLNGHGKGRASKDGEARARAEWRMPILSSGEIGIAAKIREGRGTPKQGQLVRIIDLPADAGKGLGVFENIHGAANAAEFANTLKAAALRHYGVAGDAFLREITENVDEVREYVSRRIKALMEQWGIDGDNGQVSRVAHRFAIVVAAGELARDKLDLPWGEEEVETAVYACFNAWLESRGGSGAGEIMDAIHKLRSVIDAHGEARFLNLDKLDEGEEPRIPVRDLLGYRFGKGDAVIWAFTESAWKETLGGVADLRFLERELHRRGIIQVTTSQLQQGRFRLAKKIKGRSCRVAAVCAAKLFDEGDDPEQTSF